MPTLPARARSTTNVTRRIASTSDRALQDNIKALGQSRKELEGLDKTLRRVLKLPSDKTRGALAKILHALTPQSLYPHLPERVVKLVAEEYDVLELRALLPLLQEGVDVVNGYKVKRSDPWYRLIIGGFYQVVMRFVFQLPMRDPDCDFRLIRKRALDAIACTSTTGTICIELVKRLNLAGAQFAEVGVSHYFRTYGKSQFFNVPRVARTLWHLIGLWFSLFVVPQKLTQIEH